MNHPRNLHPLYVVFFAFSLLAATAGHAYEYPSVERGFKPERAFQVGDVDQIHLFNGGLSLTLPIGQRYPLGLGSELSYGLMLVYNSQVWDYASATAPPWYPDPEVTQAWPVRGANAGLGWRLSLGEYWDQTVIGVGSCRDCYIGPDGARHPFYQTLHPDVADDSTNTLYTRDGTYLRLRKSVREIDFPNGEIHRFDTAGRLTQIRDRRGNTVNVTYGATSWTIADSYGRSHTVNLVSVSHYGQAVGSVVLKTFGGTQATYTFSYSQVQVPRGCLDTDPETSATLLLPLLTGVTQPDGSTWAMPTSSYYLTSSSAPCEHLDYVAPLEGLLTKVKLPTRGSVAWTYQAYNFPVPIEGDEGLNPLWLMKTAGVSTRTLSDAAGASLGTWTYVQTLPGGQAASEAITSVTSPLGDRTDHYFRVGSEPDPLYGLPFSAAESAPGRTDLFRSTKAYDCAAGGTGCTLRRTTYVKYRTDSPFPGGPEFNPRLEASYTRFHDDADRWHASDFSSFDGLGHFRTESLSGNFGSGDAKTSTSNTNPTRGTYPGSFVMPASADPWVLETYDYRSTTEGAMTFRTDFCFDTATGFLNRFRARKSTAGAIGANDVVTVLTRDGVNQKIVEQSYGGDLATVGTTALCSLALGTDSYRLDHTFQYGSLKTSQFSTAAGASVLKTVDRTIDLNTGLAATEKDPAGVTTTFVYDAMGRVTEAKPAFDAWVGYTYVAPVAGNAAVKIRTYPNGTWANPLTDEEITFDDLGRVWRERRRMPGGVWSRRTTLYDALSQVTDVSEWQADANNTAWTKSRNFDPFGRVGFVDPPEGSSHRVSFAYTGDRVVSRTAKVGTALVSGAVTESSVTVTERFDRQGRLYQVVDAAGTTTYGYDPAGRLTSVSMPNQTRTFSYDGRGFLTSEKHPEKGASGNGTVTHSRYDARGNVGSRSDGPMSVDYVYDRAARLLRVEVPGTGADLKVFTYGTGTAAADRSAGKVKTADRFNYVTAGTTAYTVQVRETYTYGGLSGRVSKRDTQTWVNGTAAESFTQSFNAYDALGNLTSLSYPQCTHAACAAPAPRTVTFGYGGGRLTSVPGWASSVTYHLNGMMATVAHANGVTVTQANDDFSRPRPKSITTSGAYDAAGTTPANFTTSTYVYDGSDNVIHIGSGRFVYDSLSRLTSASLTTGINGGATANKTQSYGYDVLGNLTSTTTNGVVVNSPAAVTTNRLTGSVAYDAAGNLTSWNGNVYDYDRLGMMWRMKSGSIEDLYLYTADDERIWVYHLGNNTSMWTLRDLSGKVLREYTNNAGTWSVAKDYVYREGQLLAAWTAAGVNHFHLDHLGTPRLITKDAGKQVAYHAYYPFGQEATSPTLDTERMKFTGHERDLNATGGANPAADDLDYMHARFCNPQLGRFLRVDPGKGWDPRAPQSWNLYAYARDNPLKYVDPDGEIVETAWDAFNIGLGVVSLVDNVRNRRFGWALLDLGGIVVDSVAAAVPVVPGGVGTAIKVGRGADAAITVARGADSALTLRSLTRANFRENLARFTGRIVEGAQAHHVLPVKFESKFSKAFEGTGLSIHDPRFGAWWEKADHLRNAQAYNADWEVFFRNNSQPTVEQILRKADELSGKYGFSWK